MKMIDLPVADAEELFMVLDYDGSGELSVDEFIGGCVRMKVRLAPRPGSSPAL